MLHVEECNNYPEQQSSTLKHTQNALNDTQNLNERLSWVFLSYQTNSNNEFFHYLSTYYNFFIVFKSILENLKIEILNKNTK